MNVYSLPSTVCAPRWASIHVGGGTTPALEDSCSGVSWAQSAGPFPWWGLGRPPLPQESTKKLRSDKQSRDKQGKWEGSSGGKDIPGRGKASVWNTHSHRIQRPISWEPLKWMASRASGKQVFLSLLLHSAFSSAPALEPALTGSRGHGLQFSGILLPLTLELQATGFLELQILFELQLKLEMCFESHYASIFIPSVYDTYRWTLWFITHTAH